MKKLFLLIGLFTAFSAGAQLSKGSQLIGLQTTLSESNIYYTYDALSFGSSSNRYGLNLVPTYGYAVARNWLVGGQATLGFLRRKANNGGYRSDFKYYDLGIAPFTRFYVDISRNGSFKLFGAASLELAHGIYKSEYGNPPVPVSDNSYTNLDATIGGGFAYFSKKFSMDIYGGLLGVRLGFYKTLQSEKK